MNIRDLVAMARDGRSFEQLADALPDSPSRQRWHQLASGTKAIREFPEPRTIIAMATVLKVTPQSVLLAFAETLGIPTRPESRLVALLPAGVERLSDDQVRALLASIRVMLPTDDVGAVEYDWGQAARRTQQVPRAQQVQHIDPVADDGEPGEE